MAELDAGTGEESAHEGDGELLHTSEPPRPAEHGTSWRAWKFQGGPARAPAPSGAQRAEGPERGSWDPIGVWDYAGGRVYSTAMIALCLEAPFRYARVLEQR